MKEKNKATIKYLRWGIPLMVLLVVLVFRGNEMVGAYYLNRGAQALFEKDTQNVVRNLKVALHYQPDNALANRRLAQAYLELNQPEQALEAAWQAILLSPDDVLVQLLLGDIYDQLGDSAQAIAYYESSTTEDRQIQLAVNYLQLADQLWSEGKQEEAVAIWRDKARDNEYSSLYANWRLAQYYANDEKSAALYREAVRYFPLESVAPPPDSRLAAYQTQSILGVVTDKIWTRETLLNVVSYRVWQGQTIDGTESLLKSMIAANPHDANLRFYLGELYYQWDDWDKAEVLYRQVLDEDMRYAQAYLRMGMMSEAMGWRVGQFKRNKWFKSAANWYKLYYDLTPSDPLGLKKLVDLCKLSQCDENIWLTRLNDYLINRKPEFVVNQKLDDWLLVGYDVDEIRLFRGEPVVLWLYWQAMTDAESSTDGDNIYQFGRRRVQVLEDVQNLVVNGGFETGQATSGFPDYIYKFPLEARTVVMDIRDGQITQVGLLSNTEEFSATSFVTKYFPVEQDDYYLQAGWLKSEEGNGYLGRQWGGNLKKEVRKYTYVASSARPAEWTHYAALVKPPEGASEARVWLLNFQSTGKVYFDNVIFVEINALE